MTGFVKDPQAVLDYGFDWSLWLGTDTISNSVWTVESGLTIVAASETNTNTTTRVFVSGGTAKLNYWLKNNITTVGSRTDERTMEIRVRQR